MGRFNKKMRRKNKHGSLRIPLWTPFQRCQPVIGEIPIPLRRLYTDADEMYVNSRYTVFLRHCGKFESETIEGAVNSPLIHLSIRRNDRQPIHDWRDLQRIKNELVSPEAEAVELYPAESRKVDTSNQYHLWVFPHFRFPFGYQDRLVLNVNEGPEVPNAVQRPFEEK